MEGSEGAVRNYVHKLDFGVSDAFKSARYGFNARNIWAFWKGAAGAWLIWTVFVYAGFFAAGDSIPERFSSSILCPLPDALFMASPVAVAFLAAGTLLALLTLLTTAFRVSRMTFEQLRGDRFYSEGDAGRLCKNAWKPVAMTFVTILAGILLGTLLLYIAGAVFRIPAAGPYLASLLVLPGFAAGLFMVLALVALVLGFFLVPVIVATTGGDTFESLFELFSVITSSPFRLFRGVLAGLATRIPAFIILLLFCRGAISLTGYVIDRGSGITGTAAVIESGFSRAAPELVPLYSSFFQPAGVTSPDRSGWTGLPELILTVSGAAVTLFLMASWLSGCTAMWTIIYLGARHARDGEDLLLRAEEEDYREFRKVYGSTDHAGDRKPE